ncbi:MAG: flagellin lysine-N-methylase [Oscillospiraceae bacterium]|nr:flagellin lysine-N-methylase [Oscillospiraceae bacterium]
MDTIKAYQPAYYKKFLCDSNECKNNCCSRGWGIPVDNHTYAKYMALEGEWKEKFEGKFAPLKNSSSDNRFVLDEKGECFFLNERGLCAIQLEQGYEALCLTCRIYPRKLCYVDGVAEAYMQPSCEIAAKQILFEKEMMKLEDGTVSPGPFIAGENVNYTHGLDVTKYTNHPQGIGIFWKLRTTSIAILQSRQFRVRFRMLLLLLFTQECAELISSGQDAMLMSLADSYVERLFNDYFDELYLAMPQGVDRDPDIILDILKDIHGKLTKNSRLFREYLSIALEGFDISDRDWQLPNNFNEHYAKYYEQFFPANEQIFENYLVHDVLSDAFPFSYGLSKNLMENYAALLAKYNIIEFLLVGSARRKMKFDKRLVVNMVARFCCCYEHSASGFLKSE